MIDIYAHAGKLEQAEEMFETISMPNAVKYAMLVKAYAKSDRADRATEVVHRMLKDSLIDPEINIFNSLIDAWAESSQPDAVDQAFKIFRLMEDNEKCVELGVRPDSISFGALLKCLAASSSGDTGRRAELVLDDMERRYRAGNPHSKPSTIAYSLAIKACFRAGDLERADAVMKRMEMSDTPPVLRTYSDILNHYSRMGTPAAAERTEQIHDYMKDLAKSTPSLKPDAFSYTIVMAAWARSGDPHAADRMWNIYEQMGTDKVDLTMISYNTLISFLAKSKKTKDRMRVKTLLLLRSREK